MPSFVRFFLKFIFPLFSFLFAFTFSISISSPFLADEQIKMIDSTHGDHVRFTRKESTFDRLCIGNALQFTWEFCRKFPHTHNRSLKVVAQGPVVRSTPNVCTYVPLLWLGIAKFLTKSKSHFKGQQLGPPLCMYVSSLIMTRYR
jgi:hypothetical protein